MPDENIQNESVPAARDKGQGLVEFGRERIARQLSEASKVVRDSCEKLDPDTGISRVAGRVAERLEGAGDYIASAEPKQLAQDARQFAHRQPEVFLGGTFFAGLMLGRFLRSHPPGQSTTPDKFIGFSPPEKPGEPSSEVPLSEEVSHGG